MSVCMHAYARMYEHTCIHVERKRERERERERERKRKRERERESIRVNTDHTTDNPAGRHPDEQ